MTAADGSEWDELSFRRRMENFGPNDIQDSASAINGDTEGIWYVFCASLYKLLAQSL